MADKITELQRRRNMQNIKGKNTKPELYIRKLLYHKGFRYRIHTNNVPGHPDIWLGKYNTAIFVHGCFWHRHTKCRFSYVPKSRVDFWNDKFQKNIERDAKIRSTFETEGIRMVIVWECTIKKMQKSEEEKNKTLDCINDFLLRSTNNYLEL